MRIRSFGRPMAASGLFFCDLSGNDAQEEQFHLRIITFLATLCLREASTPPIRYPHRSNKTTLLGTRTADGSDYLCWAESRGPCVSRDLGLPGLSGSR